ncbi:hypothetical protein OROHE_017364 [Orobanche hederae]
MLMEQLNIEGFKQQYERTDLDRNLRLDLKRSMQSFGDDFLCATN